MATYTIKKGDSLLQIAKRNGISYDSLLAANPGVKSGTVGVTLRIPTTSPRPPFGAGDFAPPPTSPRPPTGAGRRGPPPRYIPPPTSPRPPLGAGRLAPPPQAPQQVPPPVSMAELERSRVPQPPVVRVTGAQRPPPQQIQPGVGIGAGVIPGTFGGQQVEQFTQTTFPYISNRIQGYLDRIYQRYAPAFREALTRGAENLEGTPPFYTPPGFEEQPPGSFNLPAQALRGIASRVGVTAPRQRQPGDAGVVSPDGWESGINQVATAQAQGQQEGIQWYRMLMGEGREDRMFAYVWDESTPQEELLNQRAGHVAQSLARGDYPQIVLESDRLLMKWGTDDMLEQGYVWDEDKGHWVFGGIIEEPQTYGAASLPGWGYNYPPRRGGGGGGGGGGGSYSYPSYLPREQAPFPRSFVGREQPGGIPQQAQTRAARFGAITWRI